MTTEQIAALKVGDTIWIPGYVNDVGAEVKRHASVEKTIVRVTAQKVGLNGDTGWKGNPSLTDKSSLMGYCLTEAEADAAREYTYLRYRVRSRLDQIGSSARTTAQMDALLAALDAIVLPSKESTDA